MPKIIHSINSFELLFKNNYVKLCLYAKQFLKDEELAKDIVQEVFTNLWKTNEDNLEEDISQIGFLYAAVRNACYNKLRRKKIEDKYLSIQEAEPSEDAMALNQIIRSEVISELYKIIATLPQGCQLVFKLGYLEGLKNPQIAKELGISINTVKTQKQRGVKMILARLSTEYFPSIFLLLTFLS